MSDAPHNWLHDEPIRAEDLVLVCGEDVAAADQLAVIGHHFRDLSDVELLQRYFASSGLGAPANWIVRWRDKPIAHLSVFPYPLWIDGKPVVVGKPEAQVLHPDAALRRRPDIIGTLWEAVIQYAREKGWPLLIGLGNEEGNRAMRRRGFRDLPLPARRVTWPLTAAGWRPYATAAIDRARPLPRNLRQGHAGRAAAAGIASCIQTAARLLQSGAACSFSEAERESIASWEATRLESEPSVPRIHFREDPSFMTSRFDPKFGYRVLRMEQQRAEPQEGLAIVRVSGKLVRLCGVSPSSWLLKKEFWRALSRWARTHGAGELHADLYVNNAIERAAADLLQRAFSLVRIRNVDVTYSLRVLDPGFDFACEPAAWAGASLMGAGF
jgi:hypothetical protein